MKKLILGSLSILAINIVLDGLALASFFIFFSRGDPILAGVPAIVALPGILFQPWFIVFFLLPGGFLFTPFLTTAVSFPVYVLLDRKGKLEWAKLILTRFKNRRTIVALAAVTALLTIIAFTRYIDFPVIHKGVPSTLQYSIKTMDITLQSSRYYCLESFLDSEWLWQAHISESDVHALANKLSMHPIEIDQISDHYKSMPPYWWNPVISDQVYVFATKNFPTQGRGLDGWNALATWNPEDNIIHMWIMDNF